MASTSSFQPNPHHWAYIQGAAAGTKGNTTEKGIMALGLGFAASALDAFNTRQWLAGFDSTFGKREQLQPTADCGNRDGWGNPYHA